MRSLADLKFDSLEKRQNELNSWLKFSDGTEDTIELHSKTKIFFYIYASNICGRIVSAYNSAKCFKIINQKSSLLATILGVNEIAIKIFLNPFSTFKLNPATHQ